MKKVKGLCQADSGLFVRNLGKKVTPAGKYAQHKFYLGRDETKAEAANGRLELLWRQVCRRWEHEKEQEVYPTTEPVWDSVTLEIADAIRYGETVAKVTLPTLMSAYLPESSILAEWVDRLQSDITVIRIELVDAEVEQKTEETLKKEGERLIEKGRQLQRRKSGGDKLHSALEAYKKRIQTKFVDVDKTPTRWCEAQKNQVRFLREHLPDEALSRLDAQRIEEMIDVLRLRPTTKRGTPASVEFTKSCIKRFRDFIRWLNKTNEFSWKRPVDLDLPRVHIPKTREEIANRLRPAQVDTFSIDELMLLWQFAEPNQRLWMLLALNCGFGRSEIASLDLSEIHLRSRHPHDKEIGIESTPADSWIRRVRGKSSVYGEFKLWPATVQAIDWWLTERRSIPGSADTSAFLLNGKGHRFDRPTKGNHTNFQIPNTWIRLIERIKATHPTFRPLSFNKLRKTAGNLVRSHADGEIAAVFLCHGTPVKSDDLLDQYTNRPFGKVFTAIDRVNDTLGQIWSSIPDPFVVEQAPEKAPVPPRLNRVQKMRLQGYKFTHIARTLGISVGEAMMLDRKTATTCGHGQDSARE